VLAFWSESSRGRLADVAACCRSAHYNQTLAAAAAAAALHHCDHIIRLRLTTGLPEQHALRRRDVSYRNQTLLGDSFTSDVAMKCGTGLLLTAAVITTLWLVVVADAHYLSDKDVSVTVLPLSASST